MESLQNKKCVNFGCGANGQKDGYINVDRVAGVGVELVHDLNVFPYPFQDGSVAEVLLQHVLEHVDNPRRVVFECKRMLKREGKLVIVVPIGARALGLFHKHHFSISNFEISGVSDLEQIEFWKGFDIVSKHFGFIKCGKKWFFNKFVEKFVNLFSSDFYELSFLRFVFPANEYKVVFKKK